MPYLLSPGIFPYFFFGEDGHNRGKRVFLKAGVISQSRRQSWVFFDESFNLLIQKKPSSIYFVGKFELVCKAVQRFRLPVINCQIWVQDTAQECKWVSFRRVSILMKFLPQDWPFRQAFVPVNSSLHKQQWVEAAIKSTAWTPIGPACPFWLSRMPFYQQH